MSHYFLPILVVQSGDSVAVKTCRLLTLLLQTNVAGIFDRPPDQPGAQLIAQLQVSALSSSQRRNDHDCQQSSSGTHTLAFTAYTQQGEEVKSLQTAVVAHDTTGGVVTKIQEAAAVAQLGVEVRIVQAGSPEAAAACLPKPLPPAWMGTVVKSASDTEPQQHAVHWRS
jgi:isopentenyl phosphate kinase